MKEISYKNVGRYDYFHNMIVFIRKIIYKVFIKREKKCISLTYYVNFSTVYNTTIFIIF